MPSAASALLVALAVASASEPRQAAAVPPPVDRPFAALLTNFADDVRALPSLDTALVLAAGGGATAFSYRVDDNLAGWMQERGASSLTKAGDVLGNGWVQAGAAVATYAVGAARNHRTTAHLGADLIRGHLLAGAITHGLKASIDRQRPSGGGHAFPSGHSSAAFLSATVLQANLGWQVGVPAYVVSGFVAWSRVRDDQHWLSDVVAGGTVGTIVGRTVTAHHRDTAWIVAPAVAPGYVGVFVFRR